MASSMAAMLTSGLMFFSRPICSICWRNWLAIVPLLVLREFHFQARVRDLGERDAAFRAALSLQPHRHHTVLQAQQPARPVAPALDRLVAREPRQAAREAPVILFP